MTTFVRLASGVYLEGLAVDRDHDAVWFSDVVGGGIHRVSAAGAISSFNPERKWTGGLLVNEGGAVLSSGAGGIMWNHPDSGESGWLLDDLDGKPVNGINEMIPDGSGGMYFGTCDIEMVVQGRATRPTSIYRLTQDREVIELADDIHFCNGLMRSADGRRLYCNDTFRCTWVFDIREDLSLANRRLFLARDDVDGMAIDGHGNIWITGFRSRSVTRVTPDGRRLEDYPVPEGTCTQIRFGGADLRDIYMTVVPPGGGDNLKEGVALSGRNAFLLRGRSDIPGMPIAPTRFRLGGAP